jgi:hypothetical protein
MGNGINYVSKIFVTCVVIRELLRLAERNPRMGYKIRIQNSVEKPIQKRSLKYAGI